RGACRTAVGPAGAAAGRAAGRTGGARGERADRGRGGGGLSEDRADDTARPGERPAGGFHGGADKRVEHGGEPGGTDLRGPRAAGAEAPGGGRLGASSNRVRTDGAGRVSRCFERAHHARETGGRPRPPDGSGQSSSSCCGGLSTALQRWQVRLFRGSGGAATTGPRRKRPGADGTRSPAGNCSALPGPRWRVAFERCRVDGTTAGLS